MMLKQIDFRGKSGDKNALIPSSTEIAELPIESVRDIINQVRNSGDEALRDLTRKFDGFSIEDLRVDEKTIEKAYDSVSKEFKDALDVSAEARTSAAGTSATCKKSPSPGGARMSRTG